MRIKSKELLRHWYTYGTYFGFPDCCKEFFLKNANNPVGKKGGWWLRFYPFWDQPFKGTGYIPCVSCSSKTDVELITLINSNRLCSTPFPDRRNQHEFFEAEVNELLRTGKIKVPDSFLPV